MSNVGPGISTEAGELQVKYGVRGAVSYSVEVYHRGLHKHRLVRGPDGQVVLAKAHLQAAEWDSMWAKKLGVDERIRTAYLGKEQAVARTEEAQRILQSLRAVLTSSLPDSKIVDWDGLKDQKSFLKPPPEKLKRPSPPIPRAMLVAPDRNSPRFHPRLSILDRIIRSRRMEKERTCAQLFEADSTEWEAERERISAANEAAVEAHNKHVADLYAADIQAVKDWEAERERFFAKQKEQHDAIDGFRARYEAREPEAIIEYCDLVLTSSEYPDCVPKEFELDFNEETGVLVINYRLPAPADLPTLVEVKYIQSTATLTGKYLSDSNQTKLYDDLIYQIALRVLNELFEGDQCGALKAVVFNGFVTAIDKGTGNEATACIISVQTSKEVFQSINLSKVDPKACFRQLKGVGSSKLHSITPVAPILNLRREDERFIPSLSVVERLNEGYNLAAMDWEDFEHLIREIFEKEFTASGGEVRVTQASRDGGVDAVAFDPDPIRGGKIVIQAKRYTNTVGVSAVRDLYGTLMNEGATKGILVTTSDYGPDAYEFANGKPITLMNGSNLLHLLERHGTKAHINLPEARRLGVGRSATPS